MDVPGLYPAISGKGPWPKLGKNYQLNIKIGKNNDIKHNNGSKIHPQNQVLFFRLSNAKHKCLIIILIWVIVSHKWLVVSNVKKKILLFLIGIKYMCDWEKGGYFPLEMGPIMGAGMADKAL